MSSGGVSVSTCPAAPPVRTIQPRCSRVRVSERARAAPPSTSTPTINPRPRTSVTPQPWNLPDSDFRGFDAVVLRSNWDYHLDPDGFRAWLARVEGDGARVFNPPDLVRWNVSKRYLQALGSAGVPTVPTVPLEADAPDALGQIMASRGWPVVVIKPEIGASAHGTRLVTRATLGEAVAALRSGGLRSPVIVQPFVEEIRTRGEWSLVFIAGAFTHAVLKRPGAGEFRVQAQHGGFAQAAAPPDAVLATGRAALARCRGRRSMRGSTGSRRATAC